MEQLVNFIIRPPRADYNPKNNLLDQEFMLKGRWVRRKDLEITNTRGNVLQCSHYAPLEVPEGKALPCVIYCHGNSGCRADSSEAAIILLPSNISVFPLDFSGSGLSEGEHVSLGWNEGDKNIIKFDGDHNSPRPQFYFDSITIFFHNVLNPPKDLPDEHHLHAMNEYFDQDNWDTINDMEYRNHRVMEPAQGLTTSSTEDAISQLRSRRPMSRMEVPSDITCSENKRGPEENGSESDLDPSSRLYGNGHPGGWRVPARTDGEYVEYSIDGLSDVPSTIEDEERMIMEAIIESLKDLKQGKSQEDEQCSGSTASCAAPVSTSVSNGLSDTEGSSSSVTTNSKLSEPAFEMTESGETEPLMSKECTGAEKISSYGHSVAGDQDTEMAAGTRATLVVQKNPENPTSNVMEGLAHRWGNLFRNSR